MQTIYIYVFFDHEAESHARGKGLGLEVTQLMMYYGELAAVIGWYYNIICLVYAIGFSCMHTHVHTHEHVHIIQL